MNPMHLTWDSAAGAGPAADLAVWLVDVAAKTFLLLAVTLAAALLMRRRSAATVHGIWVVGFGGCLLIPLIALVAPTWTLAVLPESTPTVDAIHGGAPESMTCR